VDRIPAIRAALALLIDDPPLALGRSKLAIELFPRELSAGKRGARLKQRLLEAIECLRLPGPIDPTNRRWWPYLMFVGEYLDGCSRQQVRVRLAIAESTYTHVKQHGLQTIIPIVFRADEAREAAVRQLLGDNVMGAMDRLRIVVRRYARNPHSPERQEALMQGFEDVMAEQVNHLYSVCGTLVVGPIEAMQDRLAALEEPQVLEVGR